MICIHGIDVLKPCPKCKPARERLQEQLRELVAQRNYRPKDGQTP